ncbi:50S ribosomal protein L30e [Candidatus Micrarchaeota archaeon]|nr:50S ribosomal protein L30e [Candidatus Micrarchaeota archaeon]
MDVNIEIRRAVDTGKVNFGEKTAEKNILKGNGELVIISSSAKKDIKERLEHYAKLSEIPFYEFPGTSTDLGSVCGKPFPVSVMTVLSKGKSKILEIKEQKTQKTKTTRKKPKKTKTTVKKK